MLQRHARTQRTGAGHLIVQAITGFRDRHAAASRPLAAGLIAVMAGMAGMPAATAVAQDGERCLHVANVENWDFLNIRAEPDHRAPIVGAIRPGHSEPLVVAGACVPPGAPPAASWCPVVYYVARDAVRRGYVKAYFTKTVPCPPSLRFYRAHGGAAPSPAD